MTTIPGDYLVTAVDHPIADALRAEVVAFWLDHGAIPTRDQAQTRADELVCVARNGVGEIAGVNTAYLADLPGQPHPYHVYRMFIRPRDRHVQVARALLRAAVEALRVRPTDRVVAGVMLVTENRKIMRRGPRRILAGLGWQAAGKDRRGLDVWTFEFGKPA